MRLLMLIVAPPVVGGPLEAAADAQQEEGLCDGRVVVSEGR